MTIEITAHNDISDPLYGTSTVKRAKNTVQTIGGQPNSDYDPNPPGNSITLAQFNALLVSANGDLPTALANWPTA